MVLVDHHRVGRPQVRLLAQVERVPVQRVGGDAGQLRHPGAPEVAGLGDERRVDVAAVLDLGALRRGAGGMGQACAEPGDPVHLDDRLGQGDDGHPGKQALLLGVDLRVDDLGGEGAQVQLAELVKADRSVAVRQEHLQVVEVAGVLLVDAGQALGEGDRHAGQLGYLGLLLRPILGWDQVGGEVGEAAGALHPDLAGAQRPLQGE